MADAVELSWRVSDKQLGIPLNPPSNGKLMLRPTDQERIRLGNARIGVLGPSKADLEKLRDDWNEWLEKQGTEAYLERLRRRHRRDEDSLVTSSLDALVGLRALLAESIGNRTAVTQQNLASLMLLVEDAGRTVLLTGDGHSDDVLAGLKHYGRLGDDGLHVDVLKVPHHGSEHNADEKFCKTVIADDYVFCGDGAHHNPDLRILDAFAESRIGSADKRSAHPKVGNRCRFLFSSSESNPNSKSSRNRHMRDVRRKVERIHQRSNGQVTYKFLEGDRDKLTVSV